MKIDHSWRRTPNLSTLINQQVSRFFKGHHYREYGDLSLNQISINLYID